MAVSHGVCTFRSAGFLIGIILSDGMPTGKTVETCNQFYNLSASLASSHNFSHISTLFNCYFILDTFSGI